MTVSDFVSLYPSQIYDNDFPIGHGEITVHNKVLEPAWTCSNDNNHRGLIKCMVVPPSTGIKIPVLPHKFDERLLVRRFFY